MKEKKMLQKKKLKKDGEANKEGKEDEAIEKA
jgi:hypothetical protein